ncbi:MAG: SWIM zinc finger family protein [Chloroflexota bacterium]
MELQLAYNQRTQITTTLNSSAIDFATNIRRLPVSFRGRVQEPYVLRQLLLGVQTVILGDYTWAGQQWVLDPVITVHPDEIFFEAFSSDESSYVRLSAKQEAFQELGETTYGTTNIDFTQGLRNALMHMRSSRDTVFTVGAGGFGVQTAINAEKANIHYEQKVELPDSWVKGFLQVQGALMMKPFTFTVRSADMLSVINYLLENKIRRPPNGMRYIFSSDQAIKVILEPWEETFTFYDTHYEGYDRVVRVWGRKRLETLQRVLPYADSVTIGVLGRGLPHFYIAHCGNYDFMLLLSGWVNNKWSSGSSFDLMQQVDPSAEEVATVYNALTQNLVMRFGELKANTLLDSTTLEAALNQLCRAGRVIYDPVQGRYRSRELFPEPIDVKQIFAPPPQMIRAKELLDAVTVDRVFPSDVRQNETKALAEVYDDARDETYSTLVAVDKDVRIRFAQCQCDFFQEHIMSRGPCEHILATHIAATEQYKQLIEAEREKI